MFRKVIIVRHGYYGDDDGLNSHGIQQIHNLLPKIMEHIAGEENVLLLSSPATRAEDSVKILSAGLNIPYEVHEHFWSDNKHYQNDERALILMKTKAKEKADATVVILVTHLEYANDLPRYIIADAGKQISLRCRLEKGDMLFLDLENEKSEFTSN